MGSYTDNIQYAFSAKTEIKREFVGYVKSLSMMAGTEITVAGSTAVERERVGENPAREFMRDWRSPEKWEICAPE